MDTALADDQPYLSTQENLESRALFLRFSEAIADVLGEKVQEILRVGWPPWLPEFLRVAHVRRSTLVSFNYDPLIECAIGTGLLYDWGASEHVFWAELTGDIPAWPPGIAYVGAERADTFRLLKLHGSLNWYWSPGDVTGISTARRDLPGVFYAPDTYTEEDRRRNLPGRVPFVVPPSATKSSYYRNPFVREIWQQAAAALREAEHVVIVGYSLPPTDLTFASMLTQMLRESTAAVTVVDVNAPVVAQRLEALGIPASRITAPGTRSASPVADFVSGWRDAAAGELVARMQRSSPDTLDDPMMVVWGKESVGRVVELDGGPGVVRLATESPGSPHLATRPREDNDPGVLPTLGEALQRVGHGGRLEVLLPGGAAQAAISWTAAQAGTGYGRGRWNAVTPSGPPPN